MARDRDLGVISIKVVFEISTWMRYMIYGESVVGEEKMVRFNRGWGYIREQGIDIKVFGREWV